MRMLWLALLLVVGVVSVPVYQHYAAQKAPQLRIPPRPAGAMTGSAFIKKSSTLDENAREQLIFDEITKGNVPGFLRVLKPVRLTVQGGRGRTATAWVLPDYLAIGSDKDYVRIPMTPVTAQKIADEFGAVLPTVKLVDEINRQAAVHLTPSPMPVRGEKMKTSEAFQRHNQLIERQRHGARNGPLLSGHKKDVVITNRLVARPYQVAIYGWHRRNGKPIQPLSLVHHNMYADYSHGIRLVSKSVDVDGRRSSIDKVLGDKNLAKLASNEGPMRLTRVTTEGKHMYPKKTKLAVNKKRFGGKKPMKLAKAGKAKGKRARR